MLAERQIPLEISSLKGTHCRVLLGLFRYADKDGVCWPGLRTLASAIPMSIRAVRRAIGEMAMLGHLTVTKVKGMVNRYRIAAKFLRAMGYAVRPPAAVTSEAAAQQPVPSTETTDDDRQLAFEFGGGTVSLSRAGVSLLRTEGKAKESQDTSKKEAIPLGRDAPFKGPPAITVVKVGESPSLKAKKKELRRAKVMRFVNAHYDGDAQTARLIGMAGADPTRNEQWWFDKCDVEMRIADWDDIRDKGRYDGWQRAG